MARNNYSNNRSDSRNSNDRQKKHSGCKTGVDKNGGSYVSGWNYSRSNGLVSFLAVPYKGTAVHTSSSGREWLNVMVKVQKKMSKDFIVSGLLERSTNRVIIKELGIVMNPKAPNGGYCGRFGK